MVKLDIIKGDIEETIIVDSVGEACDLLRLLSGGQPVSVIHGNTTIFGTGKDSVITKFTKLDATPSSDRERIIKELDTSFGKLPMGSINNEIKENKVNDINVAQEIVDLFRVEYSKYCISVIFKYLKRDISFNELINAWNTDNRVRDFSVSSSSSLLTIKGIKECFGVVIDDRLSENGRVNVTLTKDISPVVKFSNKYVEQFIAIHKDRLTKLFMSYDLSKYIGVSKFTDEDILSGVVKPASIVSEDNLRFLKALGFTDGEFGLVYNIDYTLIGKLNNITNSSNVNAFSNLEEANRRPKMLSVLKKITVSGLCKIITLEPYALRVSQAHSVAENTYIFDGYDSLKDIAYGLSTVGITLTPVHIHFKFGVDKTINNLRNLVKNCTDLLNKHLIRDFGDILSEDTINWLVNLVTHQSLMCKGPVNGILSLGEEPKEDFMILLKEVNILPYKNDKDIYVLEWNSILRFN